MRKSGLDGPTLALAHAVFFASGIAALLYQVIWQRMLALFSGADVFSVTLIVSAFMGGLGLGNLAGGHLADRASRATCLMLFALAEGAIGGFALASRALYYDVLYGRLGALDLGLPVLGAILFVSVLWPTFFMGISLPLLARGLTPSLERAARTVGSLYGWNTLGAAAGAAASTWILLRHFDLETSLRIGASLSFACAAAAWPMRARIRRHDGATATPVAQDATARGAETSGFGFPTWLVVYALAGAIALSLEIAWFRVLGVVLKSTSFTFGTLLAFYLAGTAAGSLAGARLVARGAHAPARTFLLLQTTAVGWALAGMIALHALATPERWQALFAHFHSTDHGTFVAGMRAFADLGVGAVFGSGDENAAARFFLVLHALLPLVAITPATALMGMSFPFLQRATQTDAAFLGRRVGWLQTANIAGSLAGSLLTGFWLLPRLGTVGTFQLLGTVAICFPVLALARPAVEGVARIAGPALGAAGLAVGVAAFPSDGAFWAALHGAALRDFVVAEDAAGVSALLPGSSETPRILVMAGGVEVSSIPFGGFEGIHTLIGVLPVLLHPEPKRVAVIGIGSGDTAYAAAARPETREVAAIEIIGSQLELLRTFAKRTREPGLVSFLADPRIGKVITDGRTFVRRHPEPFDVIEADALRVTSAYSGNLYSTEYFALLRSRLAPGGFAVSWLPTPRVAETFRRSFPHGLVIGHIGIGAEAPIAFDSAALAARLREPRFAAHFRRVGIDIASRVEQFLAANPPVAFTTAPDGIEHADLNSDLFAKDEFLHDGPPR